MATALFVCLHNAGRSQMSAALFDRAANGRHHARAAGSEADPDGHVHPQVIEVMRELDIDLCDKHPQRLTRELAEQADVVVTMGCGDACPYIPGKRYIDWELPDPKGRPIDEVRATRDEIAQRITNLIAELDAPIVDLLALEPDRPTPYPSQHTAPRDQRPHPLQQHKPPLMTQRGRDRQPGPTHEIAQQIAIRRDRPHAPLRTRECRQHHNRRRPLQHLRHLGLLRFQTL
jgi:arsenate reductase